MQISRDTERCTAKVRRPVGNSAVSKSPRCTDHAALKIWKAGVTAVNWGGKVNRVKNTATLQCQGAIVIGHFAEDESGMKARAPGRGDGQYLCRADLFTSLVFFATQRRTVTVGLGLPGFRMKGHDPRGQCFCTVMYCRREVVPRNRCRIFDACHENIASRAKQYAQIVASLTGSEIKQTVL